MLKHKTYFNWSSGKDSALALYKLLKNDSYAVEKLLTTVNGHYNRVSMHGLRIELLDAQIKALNIPATYVKLPEQPDMEEYERKMLEATNTLVAQGFTHSAFGDIFLEDLRKYREQQLGKIGLKTVFPIWKEDTKALINQFIDLGFKTIVVCASAKYFDESFVGTVIDENFIDNLPEGVDPCGENGEFHTFCFDGPIFDHAIDFSIGKKIYREYKNPDKDNTTSKSGFWYCDLIPN